MFVLRADGGVTCILKDAFSGQMVHNAGTSLRFVKSRRYAFFRNNCAMLVLKEVGLWRAVIRVWNGPDEDQVEFLIILRSHTC